MTGIILQRVLLIAIFTCFSISSYSIAFAQSKYSVEEYIAKYVKIAQNEMKRTGIPASITLAQGILESNYGNSSLAQKANNHFGIKCHSDWTGKTYHMDDDAKDECFRVYANANASYVDHSDFLRTRPRYAFLFRLKPTDYVGWARGLKKAGYATNPKYDDLLIKIIEDRDLHQYDNYRDSRHVAKSKISPEYIKSFEDKIYSFNNIRTVVAQTDQSMLDIATNYNVRLSRLYRYNNMEEGDELIPGTKVFLQPKRNKGPENFHTVRKGETMKIISQKNGIKLKKLYKRNRLEPGEEPAVHEVLNLRTKRRLKPRLKSESEVEKTRQLVQERKEKLNELFSGPSKPAKQSEVESANKVMPDPPEDRVTGEDVEVKPTSSDEEAPKKEPETVQFEEDIEISIDEKEDNEPEITISKPKKRPLIHTVQPGETLYRVSMKYYVTVEQLMELNRLSSTALSVGQKLLVNPEDANNAEIPDLSKPTDNEMDYQKHIVQPGETLYSVSKKYNVSVDELKKWNNLPDNTISIGQALFIRR